MHQNLPKPRTSFVGRARMLEECRQLLLKTRLLTLLGPGGCGKTRLALRVAEDCSEDFAGGVWYVDLAGHSDAARVPRLVADAVGVEEEDAGPLARSLSALVGERPALLILDGCEGVLEACVVLVDSLLHRVGGLRVLATSREATRLPGEVGYPVAPLTVPGAGEMAALSAISGSEAVRLFVERATLVDPHFALAPHNAASVADICRRLDGIPLAVELAAARIRVLTAAEIRAKLESRMRLLDDVRRETPGEHRTMRGAIQWSYDHLSCEEQRLLRTLTVFVDGWTLESATVVAGRGADEIEVLDALTRLVDKSLVIVRQGQGDEARYRLLQIIQQYGQERLVEAGEADAGRERHLDYFRAFVEREARRRAETHDEGEWLERVAQEHENLLAALAWCDHAAGGAGKGLHLANALRRFWSVRGEYGVARGVLERALDRPGAEARTEERANALRTAGDFAQRQGHYVRARALLEEGLSVFQGLGDQTGVARTLNTQGVLFSRQGDMPAARSCLERSLAVYRALNNTAGVAMALTNLGVAAIRQGDLFGARPLLEEGLAAYREARELDAMAGSLVDLGVLAIRLGDAVSARDHLREALEVIRDLGARRSAGDAFEACAELALSLEAPEHAARLLGAAATVREAVGSPPPPSDQDAEEQILQRARATLGEMRFVAAWEQGRAHSFEDATAAAVAWLSRVEVLSGTNAR